MIGATVAPTAVPAAGAANAAAARALLELSVRLYVRYPKLAEAALALAAALGAEAGPTSSVIPASRIEELGVKEGTVVLGHYTVPVAGGIRETLPILAGAAAKLGGRTLESLSKDIRVIEPALRAASRIVFFVSKNMTGLTAEEMSLIQSSPELLAKTVFVIGGF
jgi:hypothetical protein